MNVALIIFNRPELTAKVLAQIALAKPARLFVVADGPRPGRPDDVAKCAAARQVIEQVNWDCEVVRRFSEVNLGCGYGPATGLSWVFEQVEDAIVLEDDCIPDPTFFPFCDELLRRYRDDRRVAQISGHARLYGAPRRRESYFFSRHNLCAGGFATWRRAWRHFDMKVAPWPTLRGTGWISQVTGDKRAEPIWTPLFDSAHAADARVDFWDYQWTFACWMQRGLSAVPKRPLLSNIGTGPDATHTMDLDAWYSLPPHAMRFPLVHPDAVIADVAADRHFLDQVTAMRQARRGADKRRAFLARLRRYASRLKRVAVGG